MPDNAHTELPVGEASPMPPLLYWTLWTPVFAITVWGMMLLFGRKPWLFKDPDPFLPPPPLDIITSEESED